jgi:hypothetical protein
MNLNMFLVAVPGISQLIGGLVVYLYFGFVTMTLASRMGVARPWFAWIPLLNLYLMTKMAGLEWWWMLGFFVPLANFFVAAYIWSEICKKFNKPWWLGALVIVPIIGWLIPGYLVISSNSSAGPKPVDPIS